MSVGSARESRSDPPPRLDHAVTWQAIASVAIGGAVWWFGCGISYSVPTSGLFLLSALGLENQVTILLGSLCGLYYASLRPRCIATLTAAAAQPVQYDAMQWMFNDVLLVP